jgi:hypothetical protein
MNATSLGFAKVVSGAKNENRVLRKQGSGSKRQAAEQSVSFLGFNYLFIVCEKVAHFLWGFFFEHSHSIVFQ